MTTRTIAQLMMVLTAGSVCGLGCIAINNPFHVAVNVDGLDATFPVLPSTNAAYSGSVQIQASDYVSGDFDVIDDVRVYDVLVRMSGSYAGDVAGSVRVNGIEFASYAAPWSAYAVEQSALGDGPIFVNEAGMAVLVNAILEERDVFIEIAGSVSDAPIPSGLEIHVRVLGQVDAEF